MVQLDLFRPYVEPVKQKTPKQKWWEMHNYEPKAGELTFMPVISMRLNGSGTMYTCGQIGYIHEVTEGKAVVFMPEVWYDPETKKQICYEGNWFVLKYEDCDPVTKYGFDRDKWEKDHPDAEFPVLNIS